MDLTKNTNKKDEILKKIKFNNIKTHLLILIMFLSQSTYAQNQNDNWFFGNKASIFFNGNTPIPFINNQSVTIEGCATISDPTTGNLLFYTNGLQIWDKNSNIMPNGNGLLAGISTSATQGVLIVPYPNNSNLYYVFTVDETSNGGVNGFRYSIVDMNLNNGLGDVIASQKNILIQSNTTERMSATKNVDGTGYWIVIHERNNNCFKAYAITPSGFNTNPVITNIGTIHSALQQTYGDETMGYLKFSHDGKQIAVAIYAANQIELFNFDACTGYLSNLKSISTIDNPYGIEFSPDNAKLYFSLYYNAGFNGAVYQLNLLSPILTPQLVGISSSINNQSMGALQLAPDNKIYISINGDSWLSAITQPNNLGLSCNFVDKAVLLPNIGLFPTTGILGLPPSVLDFIYTETDTSEINAINFCFTESTKFKIIGGANLLNVSWNFGDTLSGSNNTSTSLNASHIFTKIGTYLVRAIINSSCQSDTIFKTVNIVNCDTFSSNCRLVIPNTFSPNNDEINDEFKPIINCELEKYEFLIFNRWGQLIFKTNNKNERWDGKYKSVECPMGVYMYLVNYKFYSQESKNCYGDVLLLK